MWCKLNINDWIMYRRFIVSFWFLVVCVKMFYCGLFKIIDFYDYFFVKWIFIDCLGFEYGIFFWCVNEGKIMFYIY